MKLFFSNNIRDVENKAELSGFSTARMMENAGSTAANVIIEKFAVKDANFVIIAGSGNNGGDGFVTARKLYDAGAKVSVVLACGMPTTSNAKEALTKLSNLAIRILNANDDEVSALMQDANYIIDAIYGIGFHGAIEGNAYSLVDTANKLNATRIALDIPSGCECDSGKIGNICFDADITISFIGVKPCHVLYPASDFCGKLVMVGIGIPKELLQNIDSNISIIEDDMVKKVIPRYRKNFHKGSMGTALLVCGSYGMAGAAVLSAKTALSSGVGITKVALPNSIYNIAASSFLEAVYIPCPTNENGGFGIDAYNKIASVEASAKTQLIGCGCGNSPEFFALAQKMIENANIPTVIDADGINALSQNIDILLKSKAPIVITPHPAEMARLLNISAADVQANRFAVASGFAKKFKVTVVLKGANTIVALKDGSMFVCMHGNPGMATAGSGDVLSGIIVSLIAQGLQPEIAAICGVNIHAAAGDIAASNLSMHSLLASDIIDSLPMLFKKLEG